MRKGLFFITLLSLVGVIFFASGNVFAASANDIVDCSGNVSNSAFCEARGQNGNPLFGPDGILTKAAAILAAITGVISLFILTVAGLRFITSGGDPQKVASARQAIIYAVIGIGVTVSATAIITFILNRI